jgi:hypothetical protein
MGPRVLGELRRVARLQGRRLNLRCEDSSQRDHNRKDLYVTSPASPTIEPQWASEDEIRNVLRLFFYFIIFTSK